MNFDHVPAKGREDKFEIVSAAYRLRQSACFLERMFHIEVSAAAAVVGRRAWHCRRWAAGIQAKGAVLCSVPTGLQGLKRILPQPAECARALRSEPFRWRERNAHDRGELSKFPVMLFRMLKGPFNL